MILFPSVAYFAVGAGLSGAMVRVTCLIRCLNFGAARMFFLFGVFVCVG